MENVLRDRMCMYCSGCQFIFTFWTTKDNEMGVWKSRKPESGIGTGMGTGTGTGTGTGNSNGTGTAM